MNRRNFIRVAPMAGGGFMLSFSGFAKAITAVTGTTMAADAVLGDFLSVHPNGDVTFKVIKHEMGQGVTTSLAMLFAEELCADFRKVRVEFPAANPTRYPESTLGGHGTGGSYSVIQMTPILRKAGATVREMLIQAAATQWNTTADNCYAENHFIINRITHQKAGFGELAIEAGKLPPPAEPKLKSRQDFTIIGKGQYSKTLPLLVTGKHQYGIDAKVPGMKYALVARCPVFKGKLASYNAAKAMAVKGVLKVVTTKPIAGVQGPVYPYDIREGVAIVADSFWAAKKARDLLAIKWDEGVNGTRSLADFEALAQQRGEHRTDPVGFTGDENAIANIDHVKQSLRATYIFPYIVHSILEPLNCTAHFKGDSCELWLGTQWPEYIIDEINRLFGLPKESIQVHLYPSGGGYGRRAFPDAAIEAVQISKAAGNIPVKMIWTRDDDHQTNAVHPYQRMDYEAGLDADNQLYAWYEKECRTYMWDRKFPATELTTNGYNIPNIRYDFEDLTNDSILQSTAWRAVTSNGWALSECFIDEIAALLKKDPYEYRLSLLKEGREAHTGRTDKISNSRLIGVLKLVKEKSNWGQPMPPGQGRGMAVYPYGNAYCAIVTEVTVHDNNITVNKVTCAVDCGMVVNPSGARNQIEGGVVWGLSAALYGGVPVEKGRATAGNFHQHRLMRMNECPDIEVFFVETEDTQPWGLGELANPVVVPAFLNAVYAATGKRVRKLPCKLDNV
ncbi:xanthine dehydrogenase family protein molybdopterin-binding subunit [Chitinophaga agrisoli]|nr:molybdopterin cofactor-binding domain-containing protein [Chitinophaga agrisoli]